LTGNGVDIPSLMAIINPILSKIYVKSGFKNPGEDYLFVMNFSALIKRFFFLSLIFSFVVPAQAVTFLGEAKTGVLEVTDFHYPVSLYVPEGYDGTRAYPLLVALPDIGESPVKHLEEWTGIAKRKSMIVLVPSLQIRTTETPFKTDEWLFRLKREIERQYKIDKDRTFLTGKNEGAHYAAYLGVRFPDEFSAVSMIGGSWSGPFEKLMVFKGRTLKQRPFIAYLDGENDALIQDTERVAYRMTQKGYPVYMKKVSRDELASKDLKKEALEWSEEKQTAWGRQLAEARKTTRAKIEKTLSDIFKIQNQ
jgi:hypothetical protein